MYKKHLMIIAGATVSVSNEGRFFAKTPIVNYLHELADIFDKVTWVVLTDSQNAYECPIDTDKVTVVAVKRGKLNRLVSWYNIAALSRTHPYNIYFLPNHYFPILPIIRGSAKRLAVYLAGDYKVGIDLYAHKRWMGWAYLMRLSFEYPMRCADIVIARGKHLAAMAKQFNDVVTETVPMGHMTLTVIPETNNRPSENRTGGQHLLFIGKILAGKGVGDLLNALLLLKAQHHGTPFMLTLVGEGEDRQHFQQFAQESGLADNVEFVGWVSSQEAIHDYFMQADVLVVPSRASYPEGVPRVIDEAIIRGIPVIATPVGGIGNEFIDHEIVLVPESSPQALHQALDSLLFDEKYRQSCLDNAAARRQFFSNALTAAQQHAQLLLQETV